MQIRQCLFIICVLVLTNCRTTKNDPIESSTTTTSTQELPSSNSDNSEIRGDSVSQDRSLAHLGITYLTEEQGKVMLDTAKQTGTILSCDELNKSYLNMKCLVIAEVSGYGHSGSPNPPGVVSILNDQILFTGEVFEIEEEFIRIRASSPGTTDHSKKALIPKKGIKSIIVFNIPKDV